MFYRQETHELVALAPRGAVLREGHLHACVVDDRWVRPSAAMSDALHGRGNRAAMYAPLAARLGNVDRVGAATVYTTGHPTARIVKMREALEQTAPPRAKVTKVLRAGPELDDLLGTPTTTRQGAGDPAGVLHDQIGWVIFGTFEAPFYLSNGPGKLGRIAVDDAGAPIANGSDTIPFLLALPRDAGNGLANTPVLIYQHGLNANRSQVLHVANDYARAGYATIGIDALWHGNRAPVQKDEVHNYTKKPGADGIADLDPLGGSFNFFDFGGDAALGIDAFDGRYVRDDFGQAVIDVSGLVRLVTHGDTSQIAAADPALAKATLDASHLVYTGESFGSILGAIVLATDPNVGAAALSVGGAGIFLDVFPNSPYFAMLITLFLRSRFDQSLDVSDPALLPAEAQRSLSMLQAVLEPGDPSSFAPRIDRKSVLFMQAFSDEIIPNQAGEFLAAAAGADAIVLPGHTHALRYVPLPEVNAPVSGNRNGATKVVANIDPSAHGMFTSFKGDRHFQIGFPPIVPIGPEPLDLPVEYVHDLALGFADSFRTGTPTVTAPAPR